MNNARRKEIKKQISFIEVNMDWLKPEMISDGRAKGFFESVKSEIESICSDEEFAYDNMPEGLQCSMRGETAEECIDLLNEAIDLFDEIIDELSKGTEMSVEDIKEKASDICSLLDDVVYA